MSCSPTHTHQYTSGPALSVASSKSARGIKKQKKMEILHQHSDSFEHQQSAHSSSPTLFSYHQISALFDYPIHEAAIKLGTDETQLKACCRKLGIKRWPFRRRRRGENQTLSVQPAVPTPEYMSAGSSSMFQTFELGKRAASSSTNPKKEKQQPQMQTTNASHGNIAWSSSFPQVVTSPPSSQTPPTPAHYFYSTDSRNSSPSSIGQMSAYGSPSSPRSSPPMYSFNGYPSSSNVHLPQHEYSPPANNFVSASPAPAPSTSTGHHVYSIRYSSEYPTSFEHQILHHQHQVAAPQIPQVPRLSYEQSKSQQVSEASFEHYQHVDYAVQAPAPSAAIAMPRHQHVVEATSFPQTSISPRSPRVVAAPANVEPSAPSFGGHYPNHQVKNPRIPPLSSLGILNQQHPLQETSTGGFVLPPLSSLTKFSL